MYIIHSQQGGIYMNKNRSIKPMSIEDANQVNTEELLEYIREILFELTKKNEELEKVDNQQISPEEFYYNNYADYHTKKRMRQEWKMQKLKPILINLVTILESILTVILIYICIRL